MLVGFLALVVGEPHVEAAQLINTSEGTIRRWRSGDIRPLRKNAIQVVSMFVGANAPEGFNVERLGSEEDGWWWEVTAPKDWALPSESSHAYLGVGPPDKTLDPSEASASKGASESPAETLAGYRLMTVAEVAAFLKIDPEKVVELIDGGRLASMQLGFDQRVDPHDLVLFTVAGRENLTTQELLERYGPEQVEEKVSAWLRQRFNFLDLGKPNAGVQPDRLDTLSRSMYLYELFSRKFGPRGSA